MLFIIPQYRPVILSAPLIIKNTFDVPISVKGVINNNNQELRINLLSELNQDFLYTGLILQPNQSIKFAQVEVYSSYLKITQGIKYISIQINNTLIPAAIQIYDRNLLCVWEEEQLKQRFIQCTQGYDINFGYVAVNEPKIRKLNITNMNPNNITIESVVKSQLDDLIVYVDALFDKNGQSVYYQHQYHEERDVKFQIMNGKRTKKIINFTIQPYQTMCLIFQVMAKEPKQKSSKIEFVIKDFETQDFSFNYNYQVLDGNLTIIPSLIRFNPGFPGMLQHRPLIIKSTFEIPIVIKQIYTNDQRIYPQQNPHLSTNIILPKNKTEITQIIFDPSKLQHGNVPSITDQNSLLGHLTGFESQLQQSIMNALGISEGSNVNWNNAQFTMFLNQQGQQQIQFNSLGQFQQAFSNVNKPAGKEAFSVQDILSFKEKQKIWDRLGASGKTEIQTQITIETNVFQNMTVNIKAQLQKPSIMDEDTINFELVQVGSSNNRSIKIVNPSEEPIVVSLYLSNEPIQSLEYQDLSQDGNTGEGNEMGLQIKEKEIYFQVYCTNKIKLLFSQNDKKYIDRLQKMNLTELLIHKHFNQNELCYFYQHLIQSNDTYSPEEKDIIRGNMEMFFKDMMQEEEQENAAQWIKKLQKMSKDQKGNQQGKLFSDSLQQQQQNTSSSPMEIFTQNINKQSQNRPIEQNTFNIIKNIEKNQQSNIGVYDIMQQLFKAFILSNKQPIAKHQSKYHQHIQQSKKDQRLQKKYSLNNKILHDIIILNDTSKYQQVVQDYNEQIMVAGQQTGRTLSGISNQSFYLGQGIQGRTFKIDPKSNYTIQNALIFQPQSLFEDLLSMHLLVKNNLTGLYQVELQGSGGTGLIEFVKVLKKQPHSDQYIHVQNLQFHYQSQDGSFDNLSDPVTQRGIKERILTYVYGEVDYQFDMRNPINHAQSQHYRKHLDIDKTLNFVIGIEDMVQVNDYQVEEDLPNNLSFNPFDLLSVSDYINDKHSNLKLINHHKRVYVAQNTGNLPMIIDSISIESKGCEGYGITIENCKGFTLKPGEQHKIHISFVTDYTIGLLKKTIVLESKYFTQEFILQISLPMAFLPLANQITPLTKFEETFYLILKFSILFLAFYTLYLVSKDVLSHLKFKQEQGEVQKLEQRLQQEMQFKIAQPIKHKEIPIIQDMLGHEQIFSVFQSAQEKLDHPNQLLLKEISNICSKKNLVCIEAQKQAIDAEKERRMANRAHVQQHQSRPSYDISHASQITPIKQTHQELQKQSSHLVQDNSKRPALQHAESKESTFTDFSNNDSSSFMHHDSFNKTVRPPKITQSPQDQKHAKKESQSKTQHVENISISKQQQPAEQHKQTNQEVQHQTQLQPEQTKDNEIQLIPQQQKQQTILSLTLPRMSKKQQRQTAQRIKEQQEMEERFKKAQEQKEKQRQQDEILREAEKERAKQRAEELKAQQEQEEERQRQQQLRREKERILKLAQDKVIEDKKKEESFVIQEDKDSSQNQSVQYEKDNSFDISQIDSSDKGSKSKNSPFKKQTSQYQIENDNKKLSFISERVLKTDQSLDEIHQNSKSVNEQKQSSQQNQSSMIESDKAASQNQDNLESEDNDNKYNQLTIETEENEQEDNKVNESLKDNYDYRRPQNQSQDFKKQTPEDIYKRSSRERIQQPMNARGGYYQQNKDQYKSQYGHAQGSNQNYIQQPTNYIKRGQGYGYQTTYSQGRGQALTTQNPYNKKGYYQNQEDEDYYEKRYPSISQQAQSQIQANQPRRIVINTAKTTAPVSQPQPYKSYRGRGFTHGSYRQQYGHQNEYYTEEDQEDYTQQHPYYRNAYESTYYSKKQHQYTSKDEYDEEYNQEDASSQYYSGRKQQQTNIPYYKRQQQYGSYDQYKEQEYGSEEELKFRNVKNQDTTTSHTYGGYKKTYQVDNRQDNEKTSTFKKPEYKSKTREIRIQEEEDLEENKEEEEEQLKSNQTQQKSKDQSKSYLSKDDLQPFFESQKKTQDETNLQSSSKQGGKVSILTSPNSNIGGSLFSFNPLNIFSQQQSSQTQEKQRSPTPEYKKSIKHVIEDDTDDQEYYEEEKEEDEVTPKDNENNFTETTDFYNAFKSASSLFSRPLFGQTVSRQQDAQSYQSIYQRNKQIQGQEQANVNQDEDGGSSLFSGSLFGEGPFSRQRLQNTQDQFNPSQNVQSSPYQYGQQSFQQQPFTYQPQSDPSLFGPPPGFTQEHRQQNLFNQQQQSYVPSYNAIQQQQFLRYQQNSLIQNQQQFNEEEEDEQN